MGHQRGHGREFGYQGDYVVMPNGCDMPKVDVSQSQVDMIRRKHNIPDGVPVFIYVGRMIWYKNIRLILDACKILKERGEDFRLLMVGFGANENAIQKYFRKLGLADKVIYTGKVLDRAEIQGYYGISDLLLFPSVFDTNGLVVREAASCGTPSLLVAGRRRRGCYRRSQWFSLPGERPQHCSAPATDHAP